MHDSIAQVVNHYPKNVQSLFSQIRELVSVVAQENNLGEIEETLKWGEPAFLIKGGSTLRIAWKQKSPDSIYLFFNCKTILVETFKEVFFGVFEFEGMRAIKINVDKELPVDELKDCILVTLRYHKVKHLPLLGF